MTQGALKKAPTAGLNRVCKTSKPKKQNKTAAGRMKKKLSAALTTTTEEMLSGRAGNMKLIGKNGKAGTGRDKALKKGGSRKFG